VQDLARVTEVKVNSGRFAFVVAVIDQRSEIGRGQIVEGEGRTWATLQFWTPVGHDGFATDQNGLFAVALQRRFVVVKVAQRTKVPRAAGIKPVHHDG
jgi:hypothetical protein